MTDDKPAVWIRMLRVYREKGVGGVWFGILSRAGYRRLVVLERRLDEPLAAFRPGAAVEIRPLRRDDQDAFMALGQTSAAVFHDRLDRGHQCWGAWCAGGLRNIGWLAFKEAWVEYLGCRLILADGVVYFYGAFTHPQYRGLGLTATRAAACLRAVREQGYWLALCAVQPENPSAFSPVLKLGYRRIGVLGSVGFGGWRWSRVRLDGGGRVADGWRLADAVREP